MKHSPPNRTLMFAFTVFLSAFLLFQVQPLIAKYILPWFGGSPSVWTICLLFFQLALFAGYAYAHGVVRFLSSRQQGWLHLGLLVLAAVTLPITPSDTWKPDGNTDPTLRIVLLLMMSVGLPYFLLSTTGPLLQAWFVVANPGRSPYRLYALSNAGSLLALISYPFVVDPQLSAWQQTTLWSALFVIFVISCAVCVWRILKTQSARGTHPGTSADNDSPEETQLTWTRLSLWFFLAMVPSVMLLATTNQVCSDIAVVPFLWVLPLSLYLLSFILCFHSLRWCPRGPWAIAWCFLLWPMARCLRSFETGEGMLPWHVQMLAFFGALLACCMIFHGELVRLKPPPRYLTSFYLIMSAGGAVGGLFVGLVAPLLFVTYFELSVAITACCVLILVLYYRDADSPLTAGKPRWAWTLLILGVLFLFAQQLSNFQFAVLGTDVIKRSFYGVLRVRTLPNFDGKYGPAGVLFHGYTTHGLQYGNPQWSRLPTTYYGKQSGIGLALASKSESGRRIGIVGLGVGTLATYGKPDDYLRFYEINPDVVQVAEEFFLYLTECQAEWDIVIGDARISLEHETPQEFDLLVIDAFSSDAIPIHLLTREAFELYLGHLKADGILAIHVTNRHLNLEPVVSSHADHFGLDIVRIASSGGDDGRLLASNWLLLARDPELLATPEIQKATSRLGPRRISWTDQRNSLFDVLHRR